MFTSPLLCICTAASLFVVVTPQAQFRVVREWKFVNYTWPSKSTLNVATANGIYSPKDISMAGLAHYNGYIYITTPRMLPGTPATLSRIPEVDSNTAPLLQPYPSWRLNRIGDCKALQNVQNVQIDTEGFMYIIDSGRINTLLAKGLPLCAAKLIKHDLNSNRTEFVYEFPEEVAGNDNYLYDLVLDDGFVYISDNSNQDPGLIVFDEQNMKSWKIRHYSFRAEEEAMNITVNGITIRSAINLGGLALGPWNLDGIERTLFYTPVSSFYLYSINTSQLKDSGSTDLEQIQIAGRKTSQTDGMTMDNGGVLYYGQLGSSSIAKWDSRNGDFNTKIIARDPNFVQWPSSFAFNNKGDLLVLTTPLQKFVSRRMDVTMDNFRLLSGNVSAKSYVFNVRPVRIQSRFNQEEAVNDLMVPENETYHAIPIDTYHHLNHDFNEDNLISAAGAVFSINDVAFALIIGLLAVIAL